MSDHRGCDRFEHDDAAYVLGALEPDEREVYRAHLGSCPACAGRVARLRPARDALALVSAEDLATIDAAPGAQAAPEPPAALWPDLVERAARRRARSRWGVAALGGVAAAALIALAVGLGAQPDGGAPPSAAPARAMAVVGASVPVRATAVLSDERWGTRIVLDCHYAAGATGGGYPGVYALRVVERDGSRHELGSWTLARSGDTRFVSGVAVPADRIRTVQITLPDGTPVLRLTTD